MSGLKNNVSWRTGYCLDAPRFAMDHNHSIAYESTFMELVIQEEVTGCGIACIAALSGLSYQEAKALANGLGISSEDSELWSDTRHVRDLLRHLDIPVSSQEVPFSSWEELPKPALIATKWHIENGRPSWHWAIFWRGPNGPVVFDPKKSLTRHTRIDFWRIKPQWFIEVRPGSN